MAKGRSNKRQAMKQREAEKRQLAQEAQKPPKLPRRDKRV